jgi:hypothetical protein
MTLAKEDGTGLPGANSYASVADGEDYFAGHLYATAWTGASPGNREKALMFATRLVDAQFQFGGARAREDQGLQWPRSQCPDPDGNGSSPFVREDRVPKAVVEATCEMARELLIQDRTAAHPGEGLIAVWTESGGTKYSKRDVRPILSHVAQSMLLKYGRPIRSRNGPAKLVRV